MEFEASLIYTANFRTAGYVKKPCLKKPATGETKAASRIASSPALVSQGAATSLLSQHLRGGARRIESSLRTSLGYKIGSKVRGKPLLLKQL